MYAAKCGIVSMFNVIACNVLGHVQFVVCQWHVYMIVYTCELPYGRKFSRGAKVCVFRGLADMRENKNHDNISK